MYLRESWKKEGRTIGVREIKDSTRKLTESANLDSHRLTGIEQLTGELACN